MENLKEVVIVSGVRLPVGSFGGSLKDISAIDMGAMVVKEAVKRAGIEPSDVDETIVGQVGQIAECGFVARAVSLKAGLPETTCAYSVNRQCGSGLQAIADAVMEIQTGFADVVVAAGTENISQLPYYVKDGTVTAGNSSSLNDGAAAVVVMSREKADALGVKPLLTIKGCTVAGNDGAVMGYAPKLSSEKLAAKLGLDLKAIDMFEINEAFASQAFAVRRDLGLDPEKVNIYGGGISIGHPIGATGVILAVKVLYELQRTDKKDAMVSMCIGGGQGISMYFTKD